MHESKRHSISFSSRSIEIEKESVPNIFDIKYTPTVLMKYPKIHDATNAPFPAYAAMVKKKKAKKNKHKYTNI